MMKEKLIVPTVIILIAALLRIVPHIPNVAPIAGMALFGGMYLDRKFAFIIPLTALFISDIFLGFHNTMPFVYASFLLSGLIGIWAGKKKTFGRTVSAILLSSVLFFLITNIGVWLVSGMYERSPKGLLESFVLALPFFRNTMFGDLLYTTAFIILYEIMMAIARRKALAFAKRKK